MRSLFLLTLFLCAVVAPIAAADSAAASAFSQAMGSEDYTAKKKAMQELISLPKDQDDAVLSLLVGAVDDRQIGKTAISALRSRTGLSPSASRGGGGYPGYPADDSAGAWQAWLTARKAEMDLKAKAKELEKKIEKVAEKVKAIDTSNPEGATADPRAPQNLPPPTDLGGLDRIHFVNGSTLLGYIISRRADAEGNLVSIRVAHPDGAGEESIIAELIARIDEDIQ